MCIRDSMLFIGCSPCQYWSVIRTKRDKSFETKNLLGDFKKFVDHYRPGYIVIENVPGIKSKRDESGLDDFLKFLFNNKYNYDYGIINANDYGVPQTRKRFLLIASRVKTVSLPKKKRGRKATVKKFIGVKNGFLKVKAGNIDKTDFMHTVAGLEQINIDRLNKTKKNGGTRDGWADDDTLQLETYKKHDGFKDVYGRMSWDKAGPTITTKFFSLSNGRFGHPEELRAISLREGATLQTFPKKYLFKHASIAGNARLIGNAVPPELSFRIGKSIL
ncbi:MAG: DNA cytosine methyltransferase [Ignavibacteriaceae bacterium]|nr:DNA cytosine methyltransferase [Ignavibacteriaceae bacterium]